MLLKYGSGLAKVTRVYQSSAAARLLATIVQSTETKDKGDALGMPCRRSPKRNKAGKKVMRLLSRRSALFSVVDRGTPYIWVFSCRPPHSPRPHSRAYTFSARTVLASSPSTPYGLPSAVLLPPLGRHGPESFTRL